MAIGITWFNNKHLITLITLFLLNIQTSYAAVQLTLQESYGAQADHLNIQFDYSNPESLLSEVAVDLSRSVAGVTFDTASSTDYNVGIGCSNCGIDLSILGSQGTVDLETSLDSDFQSLLDGQQVLNLRFSDFNAGEAIYLGVDFDRSIPDDYPFVESVHLEGGLFLARITTPGEADTIATGIFGPESATGTAKRIPPPPDFKWLNSNEQYIDLDLPTIVLTHGMQTTDDPDLWTGFKEEKDAGTLLHWALQGHANIIQYVWKDANQVNGIPEREEYYRTWLHHKDAGVDLAKQLIAVLGAGYDKPIHFIGHSFGTAVNAYAARLFLLYAENVTQAQFTALDRPDRIAEIPIGNEGDSSSIAVNAYPEETGIFHDAFKYAQENACSIPSGCPFSFWKEFYKHGDDLWESRYGFTKDFFRDVLPKREGLTLVVDNYYASPSQNGAGVGDCASGPAFNYELVSPNDVGDALFLEEATFGLVDNDHSGVHQWYRWTINPNDALFSESTGLSGIASYGVWTVEPPPPVLFCSENGTYTNPDFSNTPRKIEVSFDPDSESLNPCVYGWNISLANPSQHTIPTNNGDTCGLTQGPTELNSKELTLLDFASLGNCQTSYEYGGKVAVVCKEGSSSFASGQIEIPESSDYFSFDYMFENLGDGDYVTLFLDDVPIWNVAAASSFIGGFVDSGPISLGDLVGSRTLTIALNGVGERNAEFRIKNIQALEISENGGGDVDSDGPVDLNGTVQTTDRTDICAMVLASGKYMFSCNPVGAFSLVDLPRENNGTVKRQIYADGFFPTIDILTGSGSEAVVMTRSGACPSYNIPYDPAFIPGSAGKRINISGKVLTQNSQTPICAMALANGQYMFSCDGTGSYALNIPLDTNGQFKLQVYADGFAPTIQTFDEFQAINDVRMARAVECQ